MTHGVARKRSRALESVCRSLHLLVSSLHTKRLASTSQPNSRFAATRATARAAYGQVTARRLLFCAEAQARSLLPSSPQRLSLQPGSTSCEALEAQASNRAMPGALVRHSLHLAKLARGWRFPRRQLGCPSSAPMEAGSQQTILHVRKSRPQVPHP